MLQNISGVGWRLLSSRKSISIWKILQLLVKIPTNCSRNVRLTLPMLATTIILFSGVFIVISSTRYREKIERECAFKSENNRRSLQADSKKN